MKGVNVVGNSGERTADFVNESRGRVFWDRESPVPSSVLVRAFSVDRRLNIGH